MLECARRWVDDPHAAGVVLDQGALEANVLARPSAVTHSICCETGLDGDDPPAIIGPQSGKLVRREERRAVPIVEQREWARRGPVYVPLDSFVEKIRGRSSRGYQAREEG